MPPRRHIAALEPNCYHSLVPLLACYELDPSQLGELTAFECVIHKEVDGIDTFVPAVVFELNRQAEDRS
jgi:hypothetical protein